MGLGMVLPILRQPFIFALAGIPAGLGFLLTIPAWYASVSDLNPEKRGANLGAVMAAQGVGMIIGAPIGAFLYERLRTVGEQIGLGRDFGHYAPFGACAIAVTFGWLLSIRVLREEAPQKV